MYCSQYKPKTIGRCIYFINQYCGLRVAENCIFSSEGVNLLNGDKATISYDNDGNPFFDFYEGPLKEYYTNIQIEERTYTIKNLTKKDK